MAPLPLLLFILGFPLLLKGADFLVEGASALARRMGISPLIIGFTIVAFGTSMPELVVNVLSATQGNPDLAIGNILGSNVANILLILGVSALVHPIIVRHDVTAKAIPFSLLTVLVLFLAANDTVLEQASTAQISRIDGLLMLCFFGLYMAYVLDKSREDQVAHRVPAHRHPSWRALSFIGLGLIGLVVGGEWIVSGAVELGEWLGFSQAFLGLTVVAVGTSLPELATSVVASLKKENDIAIGNILGSNIFNILFILGVTGIITPLPFHNGLNADILMVMLSTFILFLAVFKGPKDNDITRWQGAGFVGIYLGYLVYLVVRG